MKLGQWLSKFGLGRMKTSPEHKAELTLKNGSKVAVIGGGPAGSFFSYFLLDMAPELIWISRSMCTSRRITPSPDKRL